jgi:hypothetical protein
MSAQGLKADLRPGMPGLPSAICGHWRGASVHVGVLVWQAGLEIPSDKPVSRGRVAKRLSFDPIANSETGISGKKEAGLFARLAYELEKCSHWFTLGFAGACALGSVYGFSQGAWPFGVVEVV